MKKVIVSTGIIAVIYFLATTFFMNSRLAIDTLIDNYSLTYKVHLFIALILGMWSVMGPVGLITLLATALLTGANLTLLAQRMFDMSKVGNLHVVVGGSTLLGLATSGCVACGLPLFSLLGISGSLAFLPFRGLELTYISIILLVISLVLLVKTRSAQSCRVSTS